MRLNITLARTAPPQKKMQNKVFAASVNCDDIRQCADVGLELDELPALTLTIEAMHARAAGLGLSQ